MKFCRWLPIYNKDKVCQDPGPRATCDLCVLHSPFPTHSFILRAGTCRFNKNNFTKYKNTLVPVHANTKLQKQLYSWPPVKDLFLGQVKNNEATQKYYIQGIYFAVMAYSC